MLYFLIILSAHKPIALILIRFHRVWFKYLLSITILEERETVIIISYAEANYNSLDS